MAAPVTIDQAVNTVAEILGTEKVVPSCKHGDREFKDGMKNGRAWGGYFCRHIGESGNTGNSSGPHLHFENRDNIRWSKGTDIDPAGVLAI